MKSAIKAVKKLNPKTLKNLKVKNLKVDEMNGEIQKVVERVKQAQEQLQTVLMDRTWIDEARKYAERQGKEVRKLITNDVDRVRGFVEKERKELEKFQRQIPGEVKKLRKFVDSQKKEFEKLLGKLRKGAPEKATPKSTGARKKAASKPKAAKKAAASTESSTQA